MREKKLLNIQIGQNIKWCRESAGLTQEEFSELLEITPNHLSAIERGVSGISFEKLIKICTTLNVSADDLLLGVRDKNQVELLAKKMELLQPAHFDKLQQIINLYIEAIAINNSPT